VNGKRFSRQLRDLSKNRLLEILKETPDIGTSIFSLNYRYSPCCFSWYSALHSLEIEKEAVLQWIWRINEDLIKNFPKPLLHWFVKNMYLGSLRKNLRAENCLKGLF
jgi:hypothetical protein